MGQTRYGYQAFYANVDVATAATHEIVAAITGVKIRVVALFVRSDDVVTVQWSSDATDIGGSMQMTDGDFIQLNLNEYGHFETAAGEALNLTLSGAKQVSGWVTYFKT